MMKLELIEYVCENLPKGFSPYYIYDIVVQQVSVGRIILREGSLQDRYYDGHIGYHIEEEYRGHHYAYQACLLLKEKINQEEVIITCDPCNMASLKTIQKLNTQLLETKTIPSHLKVFFTKDEKIKNIYLWKVHEERRL